LLPNPFGVISTVVRGVIKKYPTFGREKHNYSLGGVKL